VDESGPDAVFLTGDITNAEHLEKHFKFLDKLISCPVYFVLGNHDFYKSSIAEVRKKVDKITDKSKTLTWMDRSEPIKLNDHTTLVGHSGWNDGRSGDFEGSDYEPADFWEIEDFKDLDDSKRLKLMKKLAGEAVEHVKKILPEACQSAREIILLTHVPPYKEACWYESETSDERHQPFFSSKVLGEAIDEIMADYPDNKLTVYCGHTHHSGQVKIADNIEVYTGAATYGFPVVQRTFYIN
jgi:predicted phosphohydrolase